MKSLSLQTTLVSIRWLLGLLFIYVAVFLHEDEEGRYQNRVEEWWIGLMYKRDAVLSRAAVFMKGVAALTGAAFDRLLGNKLLSARGVGVSVCYSIASYFLCLGLLVALMGPQTVRAHVSLEALAYTAFFLLVGTIPAFVGGAEAETLWVWGAAVFATVLIPIAKMADRVNAVFGHGSLLRFIAYIIMMFGLSFAFDVLYIALTRWMLRQASEITQLYSIVGIILLDCLLGIILFVGPIALGFLLIAKFHGQAMSAGIMLVSALNSVDLVACSVFLALMLLMLLHRLAWPLVERPIYACARYGVLRRKKLLWAVGVALILAPQGVAFWNWILGKSL